MDYLIEFRGGGKIWTQTYEEALAHVQGGGYGPVVIGHSGDRTLVWASEEEAQDDDGRQSLCMIRRA